MTMRKNPIIKTVLVSLWFGLLILPFSDVIISAEVSAAIAFSLFALMGLRTAMRSGAASGLRAAIARISDTASTLANSRKGIPALTALALFLCVFPVFADRYALDLATQSGIYIVLALGLNIVVGQTGMLVLGYVAFYAVGAYTYAILGTAHGVNFWAALPIAVFLAGIFGIMLGAPALRLRGDYLAIVTLGFGEIIRIVLNNWDSLTGGPNGISGVPRPSTGLVAFSSLSHFYYLVLALVVVTIFLVKRLNDSRIGRAWIAIREDEIAAEAMGVNTMMLKLLAFMLGAMLAGLAGAFYSAKMGFVSPESFNFLESVIILCMVVLGGMGSIAGVVVGALVLYLLPEALRDLQQYRMLIFGAAMVTIMVFRPQGILGTRRRGIELSQKETA
jgi:branched-chain amino acid transport system permease protein